MIAIVAIALAYALLIVVLYLSQERMIFSGAQPNHLLYQQLQNYSCEVAGTGGRLLGWNIPGAASSSDRVGIFFGGNGQDVASMEYVFNRLDVASVYAFNYPGYGLSEGSPSEESLYNDALLIFDRIQADHSGKSVVVIGQSLGSAVAGYVATKRKVGSLILITPVSSIKDIVRWRFKHIVPAFLVKHNFNLCKMAKAIFCDTLVIIAGQDSVIPKKLSLKTYKNIAAKRTLFEDVTADHDDVFVDDATILAMNDFLDSQI